MRFSSAIGTDRDLATAVRAAATTARERLAGRVDLCVTFVATGYPDKHEVPPRLQDLLDPDVLIGCSGGGVIGGGEEVEGRPAVSVTLAQLPAVELIARHVGDGDLPDPDAPPARWHELIGVAPTAAAGLVVMPEPFSFAAHRLLAGLDYAFAGMPVVGGLASGSNHPGGHVLFLNGSTHQTGAVTLALSGAVELHTRVAQGCRPFGRVGRISACEGNQLIAIDGQPALAFLEQQLQNLAPPDLELARNAPVFLGIAMDPFATAAPEPGDYLVRNLLGADERTGVLAIGEFLGVGRAVQFHLRDRNTSAEDLRTVLRRDPPAGARGALLFSCLGRGSHLYGVEGHDSHVFRTILGADVPLGGFFCGGEIGPVQGHPYLHGYTSAFGLFTAKGSVG